MLDFAKIYQNTYSTFDDIFGEGGGNKDIVIQPVGAFTKLFLTSTNKINNVICLCDKEIKEKDYMGYPIKSQKEIISQYQNYMVVIFSTIHYEAIKKEWLQYISEANIAPCLDFDTRVHFNYFETQYKKWMDNKKKLIFSIYENLADDISKKSFFLMLLGSEHYTANKLMEVCSLSVTEDPDYFHNYDFLMLSNHEDYLDIGAYDGDTVKGFIQATGGKYRSITAIEPDKDLYQQLKRYCDENNSEKIECLCIGLSDTVSHARLNIENNRYMNTIVFDEEGEIELRTIDSLDKKISFIKLSVFDPDCRRRIIKGGTKVLSYYKPKIVIQIERHSDAILDIPNEILRLNPEYKVYFRIMLYEQKGLLRFNTAYWAI